MARVAAISFTSPPIRSQKLVSPFTFPPDPAEEVELRKEQREEKMNNYNNRRKGQPASSNGGAIATVRPALVSLKKVRAASVALSSPDMFLTEGTLRCIHPHAPPISFHILLL